MAVNPCCSCEIKVGCIVMVSIFLVFDVIVMIWFGYILAVGELLVATGEYKYNEENHTLVVIDFVASVLFVIVCILTLIGAVKEIVGLIYVWYAYLIYVIVHFIFIFKTSALFLSIPAFIIALLITAYFLWVAQALINKINEDKRNPRPNAQGFNQLQPMQYGYPPPGQSPSAMYQQQGQQPPPMYGLGGQQPKMYGPGGQQPPMYGPGGQQPPMYGQGGQQPPQGTEY